MLSSRGCCGAGWCTCVGVIGLREEATGAAVFVIGLPETAAGIAVNAAIPGGAAWVARSRWTLRRCLVTTERAVISAAGYP